MLSNFQKTCLYLAKTSILEEFGLDNPQKIKLHDKKFFEKGACFVTLKINKMLRGCIGSIIPYQQLKDDIIINAKNAAFQDPRFSPLTLSEIEKNNIEIGITLLSPLKEKKLKNPDELFTFLENEHCGLVIKYGYKQATFLPSVWEDLPHPQEFVAHLLYKAGISIHEFQTDFKSFVFQIYYGEEFKEYRKSL